MNEITKMTEDELIAEAEHMLEALHDYDLICLHGSSRKERERGRTLSWWNL